MPNPRLPALGQSRRGRVPARWWVLASYVLVGTGMLAIAAGAGYWAGRRMQPPPLDFIVPTATPPPPITAYVTGAVTEPGVYSVPPGSRLVDLVVAAGGLLPEADHQNLNLAAQLIDGQRVVVATVRPTAVAGVPGVPGPGGDGLALPVEGEVAGGAPASSNGLVNLNTASEAELATLPRIGPATAAAIVRWRDSNGGFRTVDDLLNVRGIGQATLETLRPYVIAP